MSHNNIGSIDNKSICDRFECFSEATNSIEEVVNEIDIKLELCDDCLASWRDEVKRETMNIKCNICKEVGYSKKATNGIEVIGRRGSIVLFLCKSCRKLFNDPLCKCNKCH